MAGLTIAEVRDDLLRKLGYETAVGVDPSVLADVASAMNYARQTLWMAGPDYFTRTPIELTLIEGQTAYALDDEVQSVLGPVRLPSGQTLRALATRAELDNFGMLYLGQSSPLLDDATPLAYFVENLNQDGDDPVQIKIHIVPPPDSESAGAAAVEGVVQCAQFAAADLDDDTVLPVPQQYVESLFLPLARKAVTRSSYFSQAALQPKIDEDFQTALEMLRRAGGFPPKTGRREPREVEQ